MSMQKTAAQSRLSLAKHYFSLKKYKSLTMNLSTIFD